MEKGTIARRRQKDTAQFGRPPTRLRHHNRTQSDVPSQPDSPRSPIAIRRNEDGFFEGINKGHKRNDTAPTTKSSVYEENPKNFTVVNVGAGGVLYLYVRARACWRAHAHTHTPFPSGCSFSRRSFGYAKRCAGRQTLLFLSSLSLRHGIDSAGNMC